MLATAAINGTALGQVENVNEVIGLLANHARTALAAPEVTLRYALGTHGDTANDDLFFQLLAGNGNGAVTPASVDFTLQDPATRAALGTLTLTDAAILEYAEDDIGREVFARVTFRAPTAQYLPAGGSPAIHWTVSPPRN